MFHKVRMRTKTKLSGVVKNLAVLLCRLANERTSLFYIENVASKVRLCTCFKEVHTQISQTHALNAKVSTRCFDFLHFKIKNEFLRTPV